MNIQETQQAYEEWLQANPDFDEELLQKSDEDDECSEYLDDETNSMYSAFEAGAEAQEQISLNEIRAKQREINDLKAKLEAAQVHEGFVLVPKEPTGKMISAGYESKEHVNNLIVNYKAMIEAAQGEGHDNIE